MQELGRRYLPSVVEEVAQLINGMLDPSIRASSRATEPDPPGLENKELSVAEQTVSLIDGEHFAGFTSQHARKINASSNSQRKPRLRRNWILSALAITIAMALANVYLHQPGKNAIQVQADELCKEDAVFMPLLLHRRQQISSFKKDPSRVNEIFGKPYDYSDPLGSLIDYIVVNILVTRAEPDVAPTEGYKICPKLWYAVETLMDETR